MRYKEIFYASVTRNLRVTEFCWKPYLSKVKTGIYMWKISFVWLFRQFRST